MRMPLHSGLASTLAAIDNAWRAVSVWTAPSLLTGPLWELGLLLCVLPTHAAGLSFLWRHGGGGGSGASRSLAHARASFFALKRETLMAILPLNLAALVLVRKTSFTIPLECFREVYFFVFSTRRASTSVDSAACFHFSSLCLPLGLWQSKQMGTQLLGLAGLGLGVWHLISLKYTERATQQRLWCKGGWSPGASDAHVGIVVYMKLLRFNEGYSNAVFRVAVLH
jgi:hypothetical protein